MIVAYACGVPCRAALDIQPLSRGHTLEGKPPMPPEPSQPDFEALYHQAFADFKLRALWNVRELEHPTPEEALVITRSLRIEGDLNARRLAEQIEQACRATL